MNINKKLSKSTTLIFTILAIVLLCVLAFLASKENKILSVSSISFVQVSTPASAGSDVSHNSASGIATVSALSITRPEGLADVSASNARIINWQTNNYAGNAGVNINLIKKVSDSPATYQLIRQIAANVPNTGSYTWTPASADIAPNFYVEVTCASASASNPSETACETTSQPISVN